jgi:hypothetical protein
MASFFGGGSILGSSVDSSEIEDGSIVNADINASAAIAFSKLAGVQASDATLTSIAALGTASDKVAYTTGVDTWAETALTSYGRSLIDDVDAAAGRTTLGLGTIATQDSNNVSITGGSVTGITDLTVPDGGTGLSSTTAYAVLCGGTSSTAALQSIASVGTAGQVLKSNGAGALPTFQDAGSSSVVVQQIRATTTTSGTSATTIPADDTIPQNTEGTELLTVSITPTNSNSVLVIEYDFWGVLTNAGIGTAALFVDTTADAIYSQQNVTVSTSPQNLHGRYYLTAGSTSARTYKLRFGGSASSAWLQLIAGSTYYSTTDRINLTVTEYTA